MTYVCKYVSVFFFVASIWVVGCHCDIEERECSEREREREGERERDRERESKPRHHTRPYFTTDQYHRHKDPANTPKFKHPEQKNHKTTKPKQALIERDRERESKEGKHKEWESDRMREREREKGEA